MDKAELSFLLETTFSLSIPTFEEKTPSNKILHGECRTLSEGKLSKVTKSMHRSVESYNKAVKYGRKDRNI